MIPGITLVTIMVVMGIAPTVKAAESGGIGGRPGQTDAASPRTKSIFIFELDPGDSSGNSVKVFNMSKERRTIDIYPVDSQIASGGALACAQKADERRSVGSWIVLAKSQVTLDPGVTELVPFTVDVPSSASPGEHNGCIAIQDAGQTPQAAGKGITLSFRSALRVAVTVKGDIKKGLEFVNLQAQESNGLLRMSTTLRNIGNVSLDTTIDGRIKSLLGTTVRGMAGESSVLAGGESEHHFETEQLFWGGWYILSAKASYNANPAQGLGEKGDMTTVSTSRLLFVVPRPVALVVELLIFAGATVGGVYLVRRYRMWRWKRWGVRHAVQQGESIQSIAEEYRLKWRAIARVNHLKAPYDIKDGDILLILPSEAKKSSTQYRIKTKPQSHRTEEVK